MPKGRIVASAPPQIMACASPRLMISAPSPMAFALDAQADMTAKFGPVSPNCMAMRPAARSVSIIGMVNGLTRRGPFWSSTCDLLVDGQDAADARADQHADLAARSPA